MARNSVLAKLADVKPYVHPEAFLTIQEAASVTGISEWTIQRWVVRRRIRSFGFRGTIRVRLCDVLPTYEAVAAEVGRETPENPRGKIDSGSKFKKATTAAGETTKADDTQKKGRR